MNITELILSLATKVITTSMADSLSHTLISPRGVDTQHNSKRRGRPRLIKESELPDFFGRLPQQQHMTNVMFTIKGYVFNLLRESGISEHIISQLQVVFHNNVWPSWFCSITIMRRSLDVPLKDAWTDIDDHALLILKSFGLDDLIISRTFFPTSFSHECESRYQEIQVARNFGRRSDFCSLGRPNLSASFQLQDGVDIEPVQYNRQEDLEEMVALHTLHLKRKQALFKFQRMVRTAARNDDIFSRPELVRIRDTLSRNRQWPDPYAATHANKNASTKLNTPPEAVAAVIKTIRHCSSRIRNDFIVRFFFPEVDVDQYTRYHISPTKWTNEEDEKLRQACKEHKSEEEIRKMLDKPIRSITNRKRTLGLTRGSNLKRQRSTDYSNHAMDCLSEKKTIISTDGRLTSWGLTLLVHLREAKVSYVKISKRHLLEFTPKQLENVYNSITSDTKQCIMNGGCLKAEGSHEHAFDRTSYESSGHEMSSVGTL